MSFLQDKIFKLKGQVQHYAWGGFEFIPQWLGIENNEHKPFAEYWMGAHPSASSVLVTPNGDLSLSQLIADNAEEFIAQKIYELFGGLPYLFKILDVKETLSIQVHPSKTEAEKGFDEEAAAGILISSSNRNYKDRNHKPEMMVALSEFWLLHGFLQKEKLEKVLAEVPEFANFIKIFSGGDYKNLYQHVMQMQQQKVNELLLPLVQREIGKKSKGELSKDQPGWWVAKLYAANEIAEDIDRGIFSIYFFNIVKVNPGEAVFQGAGLPHAYLEGQNMELMANSDNVLRGGLTLKHIDVPELMKHIIFEGITPNVMKGEEKNIGEKNYPCPVPDFGISKIELKAGETYHSKTSSLEIFAVMEGVLKLSGSNTLQLIKGEAAAVLPNENYVAATDDYVLAYKAFVP